METNNISAFVEHTEIIHKLFQRLLITLARYSRSTHTNLLTDRNTESYNQLNTQTTYLITSRLSEKTNSVTESPFPLSSSDASIASNCRTRLRWADNKLGCKKKMQRSIASNYLLTHLATAVYHINENRYNLHEWPNVTKTSTDHNVHHVKKKNAVCIYLIMTAYLMEQ